MSPPIPLLHAISSFPDMFSSFCQASLLRRVGFSLLSSNKNQIMDFISTFRKVASDNVPVKDQFCHSSTENRIIGNICKGVHSRLHGIQLCSPICSKSGCWGAIWQQANDLVVSLIAKVIRLRSHSGEISEFLRSFNVSGQGNPSKHTLRRTTLGSSRLAGDQKTQ